MKSSYVYEWLDNFVIHELNPSFLHPFPMSDEAANHLIWKLREEAQQLKLELQTQYFKQKQEPQSALLIGKHHEAIIVLINKAYEYKHHALTIKAGLKHIIDITIDTLQEVLKYFQLHYSKYLTPEQHVPITDLIIIRDQIQGKKELLKENLQIAGNGVEVTAIVMEVLDLFIERIEKHLPITAREVKYHLSIIRDIEEHKGQQTAITNCPSLHELLVYWNLNSKSCIRYFTIGLDNIIKSNETVEGQLEFMRFQMKNITQLPQIPDFIYDPNYPSLKEYFTDYLDNEIIYLENKKVGFVPTAEYEAKHEQRKTLFNVKCTLSGDQIGLILRAGKETGIFDGSLNAVFKTIVPHLSTMQKDELSWKSMRGNSYNAEERDKQMAIAALDQMKEQIRSF